MLTALGETLLAQIGNPTPATPPLADKIERMVSWLTWFAILSGILGIVFAGGRFAWEKWTGGAMQSPKMVAGAMVGGVVATSAGTIMNALVSA
ncbi:hypothetical protein ACFVMC_16735 [Nocardia sp. NPDC127579]|uniref:hypothetical protein n=1 Tax=Nocardia sp. NPDC127579 TaxID=3345402 RepID=UPI00362745B3